MRKTLILGGPGAGKTTRLLNIMEVALESGVPPQEIAFCSFTRAAVQEARNRAMQRFGLSDKELPYFRTLHSLAFREQGLTRKDVLGEEQLQAIAEATGELIANAMPGMLDMPAAKKNADELMTIDHMARSTGKGLRRTWEDHGGDVDWFRLLRFSKAYRLFKLENNYKDFTDIITDYGASNLPPARVKLAILDEAQDQTMAQWKVAEKAFRSAEDFYAAGDDDQSIHRWAGAAEDYFLGLDFPREVLPLSHRLPIEIFEFAANLALQITHRFSKKWGSTGRHGLVEWIAQPEEVDLSSGTWLLLGRTRAQLSTYANFAREQGVVYRLKNELSVKPAHVVAIKAYESLRAGKRVEAYDVAEALKAMGVPRELKESSTYTARELGLDCSPIWHDALIRIPLDDREYYLICLRRGEKLDAEPRVRIDTIHGVKGAEAQNVLLGTDLTYRTHKGYQLDPDSERRVFYVGATRASERLFLLSPKTPYGFPL